MAADTSEGPLYDLSFVVEGEDVSVVKAILQKNGVSITAERPLVKLRLPYPIKKQNYGFMGVFQFKIDPAALNDLSAALGLEPKLMRFLVSRVRIRPEESGAPRPMTRMPFAPRPIRKPSPEQPTLTNEALEKKIEEILK